MDKFYSMGLLLFSSFICKLLFFLTVSLYSLSSFILIYILIESYLSIKYPVESNLLRKNKPQFIYTIIIFILNLIYFLPVFLSLDIIELQSTITNNITSKLTCELESNKNQISILVFTNRILLPLILIILFSIILICKIFTSKDRINTFYSKREKNQFKKDVRLSFISIFFNFIQYSFNIPVIIIIFIENDLQSKSFFFFYNIFHLSYTFNFYFLLLVNSLFRKEFFSIFVKSQEDIQNNGMEAVYQRN